jgi:hypothetical protein
MESCTADATGTVTAAVQACGLNAEVLGTGDSAVVVNTGTAPGYSISALSSSGGTFIITKSNTSPGSYTRTCTGGSKGCNGTVW